MKPLPLFQERETAAQTAICHRLQQRSSSVEFIETKGGSFSAAIMEVNTESETRVDVSVFINASLAGGDYRQMTVWRLFNDLTTALFRKMRVMLFR